MRSGRSTKLVGQVGEFLVCAELGLRGYVATPFSGNVPDFDIVAVDERGRALPIQVKTSSGVGSWQFSGRKHLNIDRNPRTGRQRVIGAQLVRDPELVCVFVWLGRQTGKADRFFILTRAELLRVMIEDYRAYLGKHKGVRPRNSASTFIAIGVGKLEKFEDRWNLLTRRFGKAKARRS